MIAGLFRRADARRRAVEGLHRALSAAARRPGLYVRLGVPDTVEGRFEALSLHTILVLRALKRLPPPAAEVAQDLVNAVFTQLDAALRESGVGDLGVSKRMKKLGSAFYGRAAGYDDALAADDAAALRAVLVRNVLGGPADAQVDGQADGQADGTALAAYVRAADAALATLDLDGLLAAGSPFPEPDAFAPPPDRAGDARAGDARAGESGGGRA